MREIKFRAWIKSYKHAEAVPSLLRADFGYPKMVTPLCVYNENAFDYREELSVRKISKKEYDFVLMQFTGLQDKDGVDIYEGDIIKVPYTYYDRVDCAIKVPYDEFVLCEVQYNPQISAFGAVIPIDLEDISRGFNSFERMLDELWLEKCEVVGNKFENPELLQEEIE